MDSDGDEEVLLHFVGDGKKDSTGDLDQGEPEAQTVGEGKSGSAETPER